jgi:endonuclease III
MKLRAKMELTENQQLDDSIEKIARELLERTEPSNSDITDRVVTENKKLEKKLAAKWFRAEVSRRVTSFLNTLTAKNGAESQLPLPMGELVALPGVICFRGEKRIQHVTLSRAKGRHIQSFISILREQYDSLDRTITTLEKFYNGLATYFEADPEITVLAAVEARQAEKSPRRANKPVASVKPPRADEKKGTA